MRELVQVRGNYFSDNLSRKPEYEGWLEEGLYCAKIVVGEEELTTGVPFHVLEEAEGSAVKKRRNLLLVKPLILVIMSTKLVVKRIVQ